jgi:hypothetical protein
MSLLGASLLTSNNGMDRSRASEFHMVSFSSLCAARSSQPLGRLSELVHLHSIYFTRVNHLIALF